MRMNKIVRTNLKLAFHRFLDDGNFPEVEWARGEMYHYDTLRYTQAWGRMAHLVDARMKEYGYHMGCYEMKRSDQFRDDVLIIIRNITPDMVSNCTLMFGVPQLV